MGRDLEIDYYATEGRYGGSFDVALITQNYLESGRERDR